MDPHEDPVWIINTSTAAELLPHMLERFRLRYQDPLIFGDANQPEGVIVPFALWRTLDTPTPDDDTESEPCG